MAGSSPFLRMTRFFFGASPSAGGAASGAAAAAAAASASSFLVFAFLVFDWASAAWRAASSAWRRASSSRFFASSWSMIGAAGATGFSTSGAASGLSTFTKVRFLRTSTWIVRALPVESARLISVVCLRVSVIFFFSSLWPWTSRR